MGEDTSPLVYVQVVMVNPRDLPEGVDATDETRFLAVVEFAIHSPLTEGSPEVRILVQDALDVEAAYDAGVRMLDIWAAELREAIKKKWGKLL